MACGRRCECRVALCPNPHPSGAPRAPLRRASCLAWARGRVVSHCLLRTCAFGSRASQPFTEAAQAESAALRQKVTALQAHGSPLLSADPTAGEFTEAEQASAVKLQARVRGNAARVENKRDPVIFERRLSTGDL